MVRRVLTLVIVTLTAALAATSSTALGSGAHRYDAFDVAALHLGDPGAMSTTPITNIEGGAVGAIRDSAGASRGGAVALRLVVAAEDAGGGLSRLVIGRTSDLTAPDALQPGEYTLLDRLAPDLGDPQLNWIRNSSVLRQELRSGITQIRDASPGNTGGQFLNAERNILMNRGWTFDSSTSTWNAP